MVKEAAVPTTQQATTKEGKAKLRAVGKLAEKCPRCKEILYGRDLEKNLKVCPRCNFHFKLSARERIALLVDQDSFVEQDIDMIPVDPLQFVLNLPNGQPINYVDKTTEERKKTGQNEAVICGQATIEGQPLSLAVMDFFYMGGSMGSVVGEKIARAIEVAIERHLPMLIVSTSGGARMQEGIFSLMQMAKVSAALAKLGDEGLPYFSLLTDPTTGGVSASFAFQGDVILAEPGALICFTGPRVIEGFMHIKVPENTINADFALQHGMLDIVVHRNELRSTLARLLRMYTRNQQPVQLAGERAKN